MARLFDPGYGAEPYRTLAAEAPGSSVYPGKDFRIEWGRYFIVAVSTAAHGS